MEMIPKEKGVLLMSAKNIPVMCVDSNAIIVFETYDCFSNQILTEDQPFSSVGWNKINPATGPLFVNGAEPGDILKVEILDIKIASQGVMTTAPNLGVLGQIVTGETTKVIFIQGEKAIFNDKIQIPIKPMIGVIGTAPATEEIPTGTPGAHGGNMDCKKIIKGSTLYLPVNVPGALLSMGDLHAVMGDGEIVVCGLEIPGEVEVKVSVVKGESLPLPMLVDKEKVITIASAETLDEAAKMATIHMHQFLVEHLDIGIDEAGMLLSLVGDLRICQVVDPLMTARMEFPQWILDQYEYTLK
ncbi:acetamidase/formamidase family protein [Neobacillus sp. PS3-40]|uniref:acetamidase/formamidase family protein n=1 Tax=Neobacillus sp. PS3-40 TaxID=3070679 RepID=UPI0027E05028|nr:acetamidase/formamidase family protein [Neobacillus sp. PS3-40]WML44423.1 acetamidase/formamidase family protein [Neobacillus sp. PS3-40]